MTPTQRRNAARGAMLMKKHGLKGYNKPKRTPKHPKKSHIVLAKEGDTIKLIRFGEQGAKTAGDPKKGESGPALRRVTAKTSLKESLARLTGPIK